MSSTPVIQLEDISFSYENTPVFKSVNLCLHKGDYAAILGPNGGGKSTLIKLMTGLIKPYSGTLRIGGRSVQDRGQAPYSQIGYVPQYVNFDSLFPATVMEAVLTGTLKKGWGFYSKKDKLIAEEALEMVGLEAMKNRSFSEISGGQRQRTLIARALASQQEILILDEPTASVDKEVARQFSELLSRLNEKLTIILATHNFDYVDKDVNRVFCVNQAVVEHPVDQVSDELVSLSYGRSVKAVHHNKALPPHTHQRKKAE
ncbi:MAG: metal ABC transporter ATP-binding protein [Spirochaetales bacterium]|nr:metal ABC transporter ATP-binding protein [Spirochaetales bacterium]